MLLVTTIAILITLIAFPPIGSAAPSSVQAENALPGTPGWRYADAPYGTTAQQYAGVVTSIDGYTPEQSVDPGGQVSLRVGTAAGLRYRVEVFRLGWYGGVGARRVACLPSCTGDRAGVVQQAPPAPDPTTGMVRAGWGVTDTIDVGDDWVSGYHLVQLVLTSGPDAGTARWVPFIVRPPAGSTSKVLVQVPVNTWLAYNGWGGKSVYDNKSTGGQRGNHVSFERPYWAGQYHFLDHEYQLVRFLEREGYDLAYVTDVDVHRNPAQIRDHRLMMLAGHGEYWTRSMRDNLDAARDVGVNIASMGANTAYWQVRYADGEHTMISYKSTADPTPDPADDTIRFRELGRPECELLGVQYDESWSVDARERQFGVVSGSLGDPWFQGTSFTGGATVHNTVGYEWDFIAPGCNHPPLTTLFHWDDGPGGAAPADAVRYTAPSGAKVFSAGSMQFSWGLDSWRAPDGWTQTQDTRLQAFMRNVMTDLTAGGTPPPPPPNQDPQASFSVAPATPAPGQTVAFTDTSSDVDGSVVARAWDLDDDGQFDDGTGTTASRSFPAAGSYVVRLRATDDDDASTTASRTVVVSAAPPPPPPSSNVLSNPSFEVNLSGWNGYQASLLREAQSGAPDGSYVAKVTRSSGTAFTIDDGARAVPSTTAGTSYVAEAWVKAATASSVGKPIQIMLRERTSAGTVVADVGSPKVALTNAWQQLTVSRVTTTTGGSLGVRVNHGSAATGNAFWVDAVLLSGGGEAPPPPANQDPLASFGQAPASPQTGETVTFTDTSTDPDGSVVARAWDLDDDGQFDDGTGTTASRSFPAAGSYVVRLRATDDDDASTTASRTVTVTEPPPPPANQDPLASFGQAPASPQTGETVTFTDTSTDPDGSVVARAWDLDDDGQFDDGTGTTASRSFPAAGSYVVRLRATDDDDASTTASRTVTVTEPPPPPANQDPLASFGQAPASPQTGETVTFTDTSTDPDGSVVARAWDLDDDGQFDDGTGTTASRSFPAAGSYVVRLRATDDDDASTTASRTVVVSAAPPPPPPSSNVLSNPSFEVNLSGWNGYQASLLREAQSGAPDGSYVAKVTRSSGTAFTIDDGARAVPSTTAGTSYVAEAWVKAATASSVGKPIQIMLRERTSAGTVVADVGSPKVALTNAWQQLTVSRVTTTTGGSLGVRVSHGSAATGNAFWVDAVVLKAIS